jgi:hypothetical protein
LACSDQSQLANKIDPEVSATSTVSRLKVLLTLVPQRSKKALKFLEGIGATLIEPLQFIGTYFADIPSGSLETVAMNPSVLYIGFRKYRLVVLGIEWAIRHRETHHIRVMNISHGPYYPTKRFAANDPVNLATKRAYDHGIVVVVAAGNWGPNNATMNPWSAAPWVIGVGVARSSTKLASISSRGDPKDLLHVPTVVTLGEFTPEEIKLHEEPRPPVGPHTSFAAPQISFLVLVCIEFIETLQSFLRFLHEPIQTITGGFGNEYCIAMIDTGINDRNKFEKSIAGGRCRALSQPLRKKLTLLDELLQNQKIPYAVSPTPDIIKKMLQAMAIPMVGAKRHEAGAGYVDEDTASHYLSSFGATSFVQLFAKRAITTREREELDRLDSKLGPFNSKQEVQMIFRYCHESFGLVDIAAFRGDRLYDEHPVYETASSGVDN